MDKDGRRSAPMSPVLSPRGDGPAKPAKPGDDLRRMVNESHPPRAEDLQQLHALQKTKREKEDDPKLTASLQQTLKSSARDVGPKVVRNEAKHKYVSAHPTKPLGVQDDFTKEINDYGFRPVVVYHNLAPAELYEKALQYDPGTHLVNSGALATLSGAKTGRSPKDKRVVREPSTEKDIWWGEGSPNYEMDERTFLLNRERAVDYLNMLDRMYVFDGFACWDPECRYKIRVVCGRPYHALFMHNMLIRPTEEELASFGKPDFTIYNAGAFPANRHTSYMTSSTSVDLNVKTGEMVILGTQYAGCMKKGVFTLMNYLLPKRGVLSLHSGCNVGKDSDVTLFFGLSGTGKTTLSADPNRPLIGDDEHGWSDRGVFNIEGGCYAKCIGLKSENEPDIYNAIRFGTVLENVVFDEDSRDVDFDNNSITENTRASYPIDYIPNARIPCVGPHPKNIIMLCCDAFGVLPPVSRLTPTQAMYYFISGYTAKVAGTEQGITEPEATFSACFGSAFLMWHPTKYASMLATNMQTYGTTAWLINTGWTAGSYGTGYRIKLKHTRAIVDAIHSGELLGADYQKTPIFNLEVPTSCTGVPSEVLYPENAWPDKAQYADTLHRLAEMFTTNFVKYSDGGGFVSAETAHDILDSGPHLAANGVNGKPANGHANGIGAH